MAGDVGMHVRPRALSKTDAARYLGISVRKLDGYVTAEKIKPLPIGSFALEDLDAFVDAQRLAAAVTTTGNVLVIPFAQTGPENGNLESKHKQMDRDGDDQREAPVLQQSGRGRDGSGTKAERSSRRSYRPIG